MSEVRIPGELLRGKSEEDKQNFIKAYQAAGYVLREISKCIAKDYVRALKESEAKENYGSPSWHELQADYTGSRRTMRRIVEKYLPMTTHLFEEEVQEKVIDEVIAEKQKEGTDGESI